MSETIVNKVAASGLVSLDLADLSPKGERAAIDLKDVLWQGLVLKEKDFREFVKTNDWSRYQNKFVAVYCSEDAIVQDWAYMLIASALAPYARRTVVASPAELETLLLHEAIHQLDVSQYTNARVVVKGCGDVKIPASAFVELVNKLHPVVGSLMYGEPCSTVPVYKRPKK